MHRLLILFLFIIFSNSMFGQYQHLNFGSGRSFTGFGDLTGDYISMDYEYKTRKRFSFFLGYAQTNLSGNKLSLLTAGEYFLGLDAVSKTVIDLEDDYNNTEIKNNRILGVGTDLNYDPPFMMTNTSSFRLGARYVVYENKKFDYYIQASFNVVDIEVTGNQLVSYVNILESTWLNFSDTKEVVLMTSFQDHFLDIGFGYGFGVDYKIYDFLSIGIKLDYVQYLNDAQNFANWGVNCSLKI